MYKKMDFNRDISEKIIILEKVIGIEKNIDNMEEIINFVKKVKDTIDSIAVSDLGYKTSLQYSLEYIFEPLGSKEKFQSLIINLNGIGMTDLKIEAYRKYSIKIDVNNIYREVIKNFIEYYEKYEKGLKIQENLEEFNEVIRDMLDKIAIESAQRKADYQLDQDDINFDDIKSTTSISFGLIRDYLSIVNSRVEFLDISELHAVIGLSEEVIMNMGSWGIFDTNSIQRMEKSRNTFRRILDIYVQPYGLVKVNDIFTKKDFLNIYTRENLHTVMKRSFDIPLCNLHRGLGYFETEGKEGIFSIIEKKAIKESEMLEPTEDLIYIDNLDMTEKEAARGLNKIQISFKIYPFYKHTDEPAEDTLIEIWNGLNN